MSSKPKGAAAALSLSEFARHPGMVGSAFPASRRMVRRLLQPLDWAKIDVLVEFGPGTGRFTHKALVKMKRSATLLAIETGAEFAEHLRQTLGNDDRLRVVHGSAENVAQILAEHRLVHADCIVSGLPFSTIASDQAERIISESALVLRPDGVFAAYQMRSAIEAPLRRHFVKVATGYEWWNIPPCHLYWAQRS
jgi:phospholipid N-methyltransferase